MVSVLTFSSNDQSSNHTEAFSSSLLHLPPTSFYLIKIAADPGAGIGLVLKDLDNTQILWYEIIANYKIEILHRVNNYRERDATRQNAFEMPSVLCRWSCRIFHSCTKCWVHEACKASMGSVYRPSRVASSSGCTGCHRLHPVQSNYFTSLVLCQVNFCWRVYS